MAHAKNLYESLTNFGNEFKLFMFCMCDESYNHLQELKLKDAILVHCDQLEQFLPNLLAVKHTRSKVEYFYTCSPCTCYYVLSNYKHIDIVTYLDADLFFFSSPEPLFEELDGNSIGIIEHRFNFFTKRNIVYGRFNVGWISFRNKAIGLKCLEDWMKDCLDWCYHRLEEGKYGDQKYLDKWPNQYKELKILNHKGANVAIWNIGNYKISKKDGEVYIDDKKLIFYHFANLKQIAENSFKTDLSRVFIKTKGVIEEFIYRPYVDRLLKNGARQKKIYAKKETHIVGSAWFLFKVKLSRKLREFFFPDLINV